MVSGEADRSISVVVHALPLLNISDFYIRSQLAKSSSPLFGVLFGKRTSEEIIVWNLFEVPVFSLDNNIVVDQEFLVKKRDLYKSTFPELDLVGTFHVSSDLDRVEDNTKIIHDSVQHMHEDASLIMNFNPSIQSGSVLSHLPFKVFERVYRGQQLFVELPVRVETEEAERIAVDDIVASGPSGSNVHKLGTELHRLDHAIEHLFKRLRILQDYVKAVNDGKAPWDHGTLSKIDMVVSQLQSIGSDQRQDLKAALENEETAITAGALAAALAKSSLYLENLARLHAVVATHGQRASRPNYDHTGHIMPIDY